MTRRQWVRWACVVLVLAVVLVATPPIQPARAGSGSVDRPTLHAKTGPSAAEPVGDRLTVDLAQPASGWAALSDDGAVPWGPLSLGDRFARMAADLGVGAPIASAAIRAGQRGDGPALANDNRRRVFLQVGETPGAHIAALVDATGIPRSTVRYHLRVLDDAGLIAGGRVGGKHRYVPIGVDLRVAAALHDEPTRSVADAVARFEPVSVTGLAEELDRAPSTVSHHLDRLDEAGLLERERDGGRMLLRLHPDSRNRFDGVASDVAGSGPEAGLSAE